MSKLPQTLTTSKLKKMGRKRLVELADSYAERLLWLHSVGKTEEPKYLQMMKELYHIDQVIEWKDQQKAMKPKRNYGK